MMPQKIGSRTGTIASAGIEKSLTINEKIEGFIKII